MVAAIRRSPEFVPNFTSLTNGTFKSTASRSCVQAPTARKEHNSPINTLVMWHRAWAIRSAVEGAAYRTIGRASSESKAPAEKIV